MRVVLGFISITTATCLNLMSYLRTALKSLRFSPVSSSLRWELATFALFDGSKMPLTAGLLELGSNI